MCERRETISGSCIQVQVLDSVSFPAGSSFFLLNKIFTRVNFI